jgi:nucleoside-diphosphate-sugar epimerase
MLRDNLLMALHLAEACVRTGVAGRGGKLVLIGSMTSYPASAPLPYRAESLFAGLPDREIAAYGVGKLAALYLQRSDDAVVLSTVDEIEGLTTGLSRKIWQKLMIIHAGPK